MFEDRVAAVQQALDDEIAGIPLPQRWLPPAEPLRRGSGLVAARAVALFTDQVRSRELDVTARRLKADGVGWYTISSAGHEMNAVVGALTRASDPAFLHYRSGAFMMARARQVPDVDAVGDTLLSVVASADDPIARGRHKVWGSAALWVPPQTSTIASHLPKAVGMAFSLARATRLGASSPDGLPDLPADALVVASFGDASANHATALAAVNAARYAHRRGNPVPVLFVCEDNGLGISVDTPRGWIATSFGDRPHLRYLRAEGALDEVWDTVAEAVSHCRRSRGPVFLHLPTVRLWGHAGSDVELAYRDRRAIEADEARDPLRAVARRLVATGAADPGTLAGIVASVRAEVAAAAVDAAGRRHLASREEVMEPLVPGDPAAVRAAVTRHPGEPPPGSARRTLAGYLSAALHEAFAARPTTITFGEDVARKGGVYHVTAGLLERFGRDRVFDTLLDETTILGVAQGAALAGLLPVPEIQYLAYLHNALDQLRGEASSLTFFSDGRFRNPMVVRVPGLAYQKGFGGHFHNDNSIGALRDIPGLAIAVPARPADGARVLRGALALAATEGRVVVVVEPIALYHEKDLYTDGDGGWLEDWPAPGEAVLPGDVATWHPGATDVLVVTYGNGVRMALRAARRLADDGVGVRVLDLRWLAPLPLDAITTAAGQCRAVLVADECRASGGGIADAVVAHLAESGVGIPLGSVRSADSYVPLGPSADHVLLGEADIVRAVRRLHGVAGGSDPR